MRNSKMKNTAFIAVMTAVLCVLAPLSIPIGPVPISLTNFVLAVTIYVLGTKKAMVSYFIYLLIGLIGIPVFSGFSGGPQKLFGPTGGYLIGFISFILIAGIVIDRMYTKRVISFIALAVGTAVLYAFGTAWLAFSAHLTFGAALAAGVIPFIAEDAVKMAAAAVIGPVLRDRLSHAGLLPQAVRESQR